jgi:uncharacterized membrane protein YjjP (DUF1212 family)
MNKVEKIAIAGITGTTFMTLFSYLASMVLNFSFFMAITHCFTNNYKAKKKSSIFLI